MKIARVVDVDGKVVYAQYLPDKSLLRIDGDIFSGEFVVSDQKVQAQSWLSPIEPISIICIGANYCRHIKEFGMKEPSEPVVFMKNPAAVTAHNQPVYLPTVCGDEVDYECELAVVISKDCLNVTVDDALDYVLGYTCANDISARICQFKEGGQWVRGKSFDSFCPLGPVLVTQDEIGNPNNLSIKTMLNGKIVQDSNTSDMLFDVATLISYLSQDTTLLAKTLILTGTPSGIGWTRDPKLLLHEGDNVTVEIEKIGVLSNPVKRSMRSI